MSASGVTPHLQGKSEDVVEIDVDAVERTLRNLLRNAVEAGAENVEISSRLLGQNLEIVVSDDGPGMSDDEAAQAFDPFFTTKARGTGLGLAIARQELEEIGGKLEHTHTKNGGAQFRLTVPIHA